MKTDAQREAEENFYWDVSALLRAVNKTLKSGDLPSRLQSELTEAAGNVEAWYENADNDPRSMGWVDDRGRP